MIIQLSLNKPSPTPFVCKFKAWASSMWFIMPIFMLNCVDTSPKTSTWRINTHLLRTKLQSRNILWLQHVWVDKNQKKKINFHSNHHRLLGYSCITHVNSFFSYSASTSFPGNFLYAFFLLNFSKLSSFMSISACSPETCSCVAQLGLMPAPLCC